MTPEITNGLFTLAGVLLGVVGTFILSHFRQEKRELTAYVSELSPMLMKTPGSSSKIEISYEGKPVLSHYEQEIEFINSGNKSVPIEEVSIFFPGSQELFQPDTPHKRLPV